MSHTLLPDPLLSSAFWTCRSERLHCTFTVDLKLPRKTNTDLCCQTDPTFKSLVSRSQVFSYDLETKQQSLVVEPTPFKARGDTLCLECDRSTQVCAATVEFHHNLRRHLRKCVWRKEPELWHVPLRAQSAAEIMLSCL